jgi:hypothetical protein
MAGIDYRAKIAGQILGKPGVFDAYFRLYDELFDIGTGSHLIQIETPLQQSQQQINHDTILTAVRILKGNSRLTLDETKAAIQQQLQQSYSTRSLDLIVKIAVQAMLMVDSNVKESHGPDYAIGNFRHASWHSDESLVDFITKSFPQVLPERKDRVAMVLQDKKSLKAWKLRDRLGIVFRGTNNLTDHLLFDPSNRILYLFHHAAYLKAHLDWWNTQPQAGTTAKEVEIATALERYISCP